MITTRKPIGSFIVLANTQKGTITKSSIENNIESLIDSIKIRVDEKGLNEVSEQLLTKIFDLRFEVLEWLSINKININDYFEKINNQIVQNRQLGIYSELSKTIANVLENHELIVVPMIKKMGFHNFNETLNNIQEHKPNYDTIRMLSCYPQPQIIFFKNWIDASLKLDFGLIVSE